MTTSSTRQLSQPSFRRSPIGSAGEAGYIPATSAIGPYLCIEPGRLAAAAYNGGSQSGDYSTSYSYDANSNLTGITRRAIEGFPGDNAFMPGGTIYALDGNQVTVRLQGGSGAFRPLMNNAVVTDFRQVYYDACGRMVRDNDKGISKIAYNELHLPYSIERVGESTAPISYGVQYAADGRKLRTGMLRTAAQGIPVNGIGSERSREPLIVFETTTDYVGNLVYKNGILEKVLVDGGFITAADMRYHFFVTDHLGNVRVVVNDAGVVEQVNQFYPYGESTDMGQAVQETTDNPYKWGGKEWDEKQEAYDFGARMYSAADARWTTMDPLSEKYYHISPYAYCAGNPVNLVDPDGRDSWEVDEYGVITWKEKSDEHTLYGINADGNKNSITIKNREILDVLSSEYYLIDKDGNRKKGTGDRHSLKSLILQWKTVSSSYSSYSDNEDLSSLFVFLSNTTSVEWALHMDDQTGITLGTCHSKNTAGRESYYGLGTKAEQSIHSHPNEGKDTEWYSMTNDIYNVRSGSRAPLYYVYFPASGAVWQLSPDRRDGRSDAVMRALNIMLKAHNRH